MEEKNKPTPEEINAVLSYVGSIGGRARAEKLSPEQRSAIARLGGTTAAMRGNDYSNMGKIGGRARAEKLSPERRKEIAKKAIAARIAKAQAAKQSPPVETN